MIDARQLVRDAAKHATATRNGVKGIFVEARVAFYPSGKLRVIWYLRCSPVSRLRAEIYLKSSLPERISLARAIATTTTKGTTYGDAGHQARK